MLDLATLKATLQPIRQIGEVEERFNIQGTQVCMRVLNPKEELEIQRWAQAGLLAATPEAQENDNSLAVEYLNKFKLGCLSHSLVEINGLDLRGEDYVTTGEVLQNGQAVKIKRTDAVRQMLENWPRPLLSAVFRKFNEIMERCELNSDKSIEFNPPDIETEIERLMARLQTLEEMRKGKEDANLAAKGTLAETPSTAFPSQEPQETQTGDTVVQGTAPRVSAIPDSASAVEPQPTVVGEPAPTPAPTDAPPQEVVNASGNVGTLAPNDGWVDRNDADSMEAAVAAENARLMQMRNRRAPHHAAKEVADALRQEISEGEIPVLSGRETPTDATPDETSANPRFVPPKKR